MQSSRVRAILSLLAALLLGLVLAVTAGASNGGAGDDPVAQAAQSRSQVKPVFLPVISSSIPVVIPDTTFVLPPETANDLKTVSADGVYYTFQGDTQALDELAVGDVMVSDVSPAAPYGYLRRVESVSKQGDEVIVKTGDATLEEAIEQGELQVQYQLKESDVSSVVMAPGVANDTKSPSDASITCLSQNLNKLILYDGDGNLGTKDDQVTVDGSVDVNVEFGLNVQFKNGLKQAMFTIDADTDESLQVTSTSDRTIGVSHTLATCHFQPITIWIHIVPVVLVPQLDLVVGADGSVHTGMSAGISAHSDFTAGIGYDGQWRKFSEFRTDYKPLDIDADANVDVKVYAGAELEILLYDVVGPYSGIHGYLELNVELPNPPWLHLYGGLEVPVGLNVEILDNVIASYEEIPINWQILLFVYPEGHAPSAPTGPSPPNNAIDQETSVDLGWSPSSDADGDKIFYDVYFEKDDTSPDTRVSNKQSSTTFEPGALDFDADYYWKVVAIDEHGVESAGQVWHFRTKKIPELAKIDIALVIDSSGSMSTNDPYNRRKDAAKLFIDAMNSGDQVAVVDFTEVARVLWPLQSLTNDRSGPKAAVDQVRAYDGTSISAGLNAGFQQLDSSTTISPKAAVFLTDGEGTYNGEAALFATKGWRVYTVGLGTSIDVELLRNIANQTGGQYYYLDDPSLLIQIYYDILKDVSGARSILKTTYNITQGATVSANVNIPDGQVTANFVTNWEGSTVNMTLQDPSGRKITPTIASSDPKINHTKGDTYEIYRISVPQAGAWQIELYGADIPAGGEKVNLDVTVRSDEPIQIGGWQTVGTNSDNSGGISNNSGDSLYPTLALAKDNSIFVAWEDSTPGKMEIYTRRWNGSAWQEVGSGSASGGGISNNSGDSHEPQSDVAPNGDYYVVWQDDSSGDYEVYVKRWNGSAWQEVGSGSASGGGISQNAGDSISPKISVAPDNTPYICWKDNSGGDWEIYVRRFSGGVWQEVGSGSANGGGVSNNSGESGSCKLDIGSDGTPYLAWRDKTSGQFEIYIKRWNGSSWVELHPGSASGGGLTNTGGYSGNPSMRLDKNNKPVVSWSERIGGTFELYLKRWNGSAWEELGKSASGGGISKNDGDSRASFLNYSADSNPYIVWHDDTDGDYEIYSRYWTGSSWAEMGSGSATGGGISANSGDSLKPKTVFDNNGNLYVAWGDMSSGNGEIYVKRWIQP